VLEKAGIISAHRASIAGDDGAASIHAPWFVGVFHLVYSTPPLETTRYLLPTSKRRWHKGIV
jgi:hypothetical protein